MKRLLFQAGEIAKNAVEAMHEFESAKNKVLL